ncbi:MAG: hypothetical protein H6673_02580 [Anaerolineales bacterium]|nr:hypothetical protein [Anaerolineales bacterium]
MYDFVFNFHSGWRFLVLLALAVNVIYFGYALATKSKQPKRDKLVSTLFAVSVDIQITLGIILLIIVIIDGNFDAGRHFGHFMPMLLAAPVAHAYTIFGKAVKNQATVEKYQRLVGLLAPIIVLILVMGGLASLELGLFQMS